MKFIFIAVGAVMGAFLRYVFQLGFGRYSELPWGTLTANLIGCFIIGLVYSYSSQVSHELKLGLITGFLGALTTMSSFSLDIVKLIDQKRWMVMGGFAISTVCGGIALCALGVYLGSRSGVG